jgi:hypothetical protein
MTNSRIEYVNNTSETQIVIVEGKGRSWDDRITSVPPGKMLHVVFEHTGDDPIELSYHPDNSGVFIITNGTVKSIEKKFN